VSLPRSSFLGLAAALAGLLGCQTTDEHPPFLAPCEKNCAVLPPISGGGSEGGSANTSSDAGTGTLEGQVFLTDSSFIQGSLYEKRATVTADGANGSPVTAIWQGVAPFDPFMLEGVARVTSNWVSVTPEIGGDALPTYQDLQTYQVTSAKLGLVSVTALDAVFNAVSTLRSENSAQIIVFFRSASAGTPLSGVHATMAKAQLGMYATATGWKIDDGTAVTDPSGLVVFGNVEPAAGGNATQLVTVTRPGTATAGAAVQFPIKVVQGAVSIAALGVQL